MLIALAWPTHVHHRRARSWWDTAEEWATTPVTESAFVRLSINPHVVGTPVTVPTALAMLAAIRATPGCRFVPDGASLTTPSIGLDRVATPGQITDVHLVNLAASTGLILATLDAGILDMLAPDDRRHVLLLPR
ncbi:hypothetical protein IF188_09350 [Microbacterium sp. NEAU-LLC]|uniref:Ribonuclease VapC n=1 Tax=Microbacterium helvum TaxID=2773713 RepID=A0ABR8NMK9_9MICO|nr:hypothetical protein [Microbacterium helvum]